jgi:two-component system, OmpR family, response regulator VicR
MLCFKHIERLQNRSFNTLPTFFAYLRNITAKGYCIKIPMAIKSNASKRSNEVLIVDDDVLIARLLTHWLHQKGFEVRIENDGKRAIASLDENSPSRIILLDVMMPFADGFEVLNEIKSRNTWKKVPVIMLTSKSQEASVVRAFEAGVDDYVTKPFKPAELLVRINRLLK